MINDYLHYVTCTICTMGINGTIEKPSSQALVSAGMRPGVKGEQDKTRLLEHQSFCLKWQTDYPIHIMGIRDENTWGVDLLVVR